MNVLKVLREESIVPTSQLDNEEEQYQEGLSEFLLKKREEYDRITRCYEYSQEETQYIEELLLKGEAHHYTKEELDILFGAVDDF